MQESTNKVKVLVVDDSPTVREFLAHVFESTGRLEVIGTARDGQEAIAFVGRTRPDIITMDINMPVMDGLEATREIMCTDPIPIVILSASWDPAEVEKSFRAVEAGALASFAKPSGMGGKAQTEAIRELVANVEALAHVKLVRWMTRPAGAPRSAAPGPSRSERPLRHPGIVVVGVSTGGPPVLQRILPRLRKDFRFPVVIVQHIARGFCQGLADWLRGYASLPIALGRQGEALEAGRILLAPDDCHLEIGADERIVLSSAEPEQGLRPAVSRLFRSAAAVYGRRCIAVLLTGMGGDGAREMLAIRELGGTTIAQDESSCVVYGMPKEAVALGAADHVLSPGEIVRMLNRLSEECGGNAP